MRRNGSNTIYSKTVQTPHSCEKKKKNYYNNQSIMKGILHFIGKNLQDGSGVWS